MAKRVLLHVGTPKTGTSAFQHALFTHREHLAAQGVLYPADRFDEHFLAALDLMQLQWGGLEREAAGAWELLAEKVRDWPETAMISHEILGRASRLQVERALASFGDADVHVVLSARDLARQLPAEWQENIKHRRTLTYAEFLAAVSDERRSAEVAQWFWSVQEIPDVLARWGEALPPDQVHVVTVPPLGEPRDVLGRRFAEAFGIDVGMLDTTRDRANASLGVAESALVRELNERLDLVLPNHHYRQFVREGLVHETLGTHRESSRLTLPPEVHAWALERSRQWIGELDRRGYAVVGELDDLLPDVTAPPFIDPDDADPELVARAGLRALAASVQESARLRDVEIHLHADIADLMRQLDEAHSTRAYRAKERLVGAADTHPVARAGLWLYRRLRGKNSRST